VSWVERGGGVRFLSGDIGGTKTHLALYSTLNGKLILEREKRFLSFDYHSLEEILQSFLREEKEKIDAACFAFAGQIDGKIAYATNLPWVVEIKNIEKKFSINKVFIINDLVLNAVGISALEKEDLYTLNKGKKVNAKANQALISAGTGLGESIIIEGTNPIYSEGGHCDFSPRNEIEIELLLYLKKKYGHVSYERVLSGGGLIHLYQFLIDSGREKKTLELEKGDHARLISEYGLSKKCSACYRALLWFSSIYGAEAGNLALKGMAIGGVFVGGGIAPSIIPILEEGAFMRAFVEKGRFSSLLQKIPVKILLKKETALMGATLFLEKYFFSSK
jgi:glucokinase